MANAPDRCDAGRLRPARALTGSRLQRGLVWYALALAAAAALFIAGCASVPQASPERDADAKQFNTHPNAAAIYVYRPDFQGPGDDGSYSVLWADGRLIGETLPRTYFRLDLRPGRHFLNGQAVDVGRLTLDTSAGELYFVSLIVSGGTSTFKVVTPETGKRDILRCCAMMENWAPGQRPLFR